VNALFAGVAAAALLLVAGCGTDGRDLAEPAPGATAPPLATTSTTPSSGDDGAVLGPEAGSNADGEPADGIVVTSAAFGDGGVIPERHSCTGADVSPALAWTGVPEGTSELIVLVTDLTAGEDDGFAYQWAVAGIDPVVVGLGEDGVPEGAVEGRSWSGPCVPGGEDHEYAFAVHALPRRSGLDGGATATQVAAAAAGTPVGVLHGFYPAAPP